jgi:hypothetical protein
VTEATAASATGTQAGSGAASEWQCGRRRAVAPHSESVAGTPHRPRRGAGPRAPGLPGGLAVTATESASLPVQAQASASAGGPPGAAEGPGPGRSPLSGRLLPRKLLRHDATGTR